ncbi:Glycosyl phosphatidyl inositol protein transamidase complex subunit [Coemansia sp. RSA 2530]|nr:Glycosyl phosphatidyl inositol protein transamidase complex subunit [Coemansia sp. RSA 2530]
MALVLSGQGEKASPVLKLARKYSAYLAYPLLFASIVWLLLLPFQTFTRKGYFSENAMMPNQVYTVFGSEEHISAMSLIDTELALQSTAKDEGERQAGAVYRAFDSLGLDSEIQRFAYSEVPGVGSTSGVNVHGVLRAGRSDSVEALLIAASWTTSSNATNVNAIRLMAGLAKYASKQVYWAKDIIFLVTDGGEHGVETWLKSYHGGGGLYVRSGIIQAAVCLELPPAKSYAGMGLFFEGKSGQLPNLDLVNIVQYISRVERIPAYLHGMVDAPRSSTWLEKYKRSAQLLLRQVSSLAIGKSVGVHAPFLRYRIDALTLSGIVRPTDPVSLEYLSTGAAPVMPTPFTIRSIGRTVESTLRSLNNLLEHFHQSFFFYILPANEKYISIGDYIPAAGLMVASLLFQAMHLWWMQGSDDMRSDNPETRIDRINAYYAFLRRTLPNTIGIIARVHLLGVILLIAPIAVPYAVLTNTTSTAYVFTMALASVSMVLHISDTYWIESVRRMVDWKQLKAVVELYVAVVVGCLSVMNFSLAVVLFGVTGLPLVLTRVWTSATKIHRIANVCMLLLASPVCTLVLSRAALGLSPLDFTSSPFRMFLGDFYHFGNLAYPLVCLVYWPVNLLCMIVALMP